jgi:hypothetical protein
VSNGQYEEITRRKKMAVFKRQAATPVPQESQAPDETGIETTDDDDDSARSDRDEAEADPERMEKDSSAPAP